MADKKIVILGGGYAGIEAAKKLHKIFRKDHGISITLVDRNTFHGLITELHEVAAYRVEEDSVKVPIKHILQYANVHFINQEIEHVDLENKKVILGGSDTRGVQEIRELKYDYLIAATGSEPSSFGIPGIAEHSFYLWSLEDAVRIKEHIIQMFETARYEKNPEKRKEMLTFIVGGGGFTGVEMMGELMQWVRYLAREYKLDEKEVRLIIVEALPKLCPTLSDKLSGKVYHYLAKNGVEVETNAAITELTESHVSLKNGDTIPTRTLIWTSGVQANSIVKETGLKLTKRNRIEVNEYLQCVDHPEVYAIGDNAFSTDEKGEGVPPFVESALQTAEAAAHNLANDIRGIQERKTFKPHFHGVMVSIGSVYAVADIMGFEMSWLFATAMKHMVNLHYLFKVGGIETCIKYLQHHFLSRARRKPLILETAIDHCNARSRSYWLAITRICLGFIWLFSAFDKISHGWLTVGDKLVSGASLQLIGPNTPAFYAWFVKHFIYTNPLLFQTFITLSEVFVALTFLSGAFTFLGAAVAIAMNINFFLSGTGQIYMLLAHIPMLGGAGRAFGIDHYLMPYLMGQVRYWQRNLAFKWDLWKE